MKRLTSLFDLAPGEVVEILDLAADLKGKFGRGVRPELLKGRVVALLFEKPSLRTRNSFEAAAIQLGGGSIFLSTRDAGLAGREALADVARVLSGYADVIVMRTFSQNLIEDFAAHASCPVVNGLSDERHPCQALTDALTIREVFGDVAGRKLACIGDGNNCAASLAVAAGMLDFSLTLCSPPGYELPRDVLSEVRSAYPSARIDEESDPVKAVKDADVVYTDVWTSMGQEAEADLRRKAFARYQIDAALMSHAPPHSRFLHPLPAHRGEEVTDEVLDGSQSLVFQQAANRMHLARGLLAWLLRS